MENIDILCEKSVKKWGETAQYDQIIEEMAELTQALSKYKRLKVDLTYLPKEKVDKIMNNVYEEIADVKICIGQMEYMFGKANIEKSYKEKIDKFKYQLDN